MNTNPPTPADTRQQLRDAITADLVEFGNSPFTAGVLADRLLAGPLADLAALPARVHQLADELDTDARISDDDEWGVRSIHRIADRLRTLTPDPRQEQQQ